MNRQATHFNKLNGALGEDFALQYLRTQQYAIIKRNYRCRYGEIDLIARRDGTLHFVEVKSRHEALIPGRFAVTRQKQLRIKKTAQYFLQQMPLLRDDLISFDVIEITDGQIEFLENCFY